MRKLFTFIIILSAVCVAQDVNGRRQNIAIGVDAAGELVPLPGAVITVCLGSCPTPAPLCTSMSDTVCNQNNSTTADTSGNYFYYIKPGKYVEQISSPGFATFTINDVQVWTTTAGFLAGNNPFTGTNTFNGSTNLNGGGSFVGIFSGNFTHTGTLTQSGVVTVGTENSVLWVDGVKYANCNAAITAAGATNKTIIIIPSTDSISDTCTIPDTQYNISLWDYRGLAAVPGVDNLCFNCGNGTGAALSALRVNRQDNTPPINNGSGSAVVGETVLISETGTFPSAGATANGATDVASTYGALTPNGSFALVGHEMQTSPGSATGMSATISTTSESVNTVTVTTTATCPFTAGQSVFIAGNTVSGYNNSAPSPSWVVVAGCGGGSTFTYTNPTSGLGGGTGGTVVLAVQQALGVLAHVNVLGTNTMAIALAAAHKASAPTNAGTGPIANYYGGFYQQAAGGFSQFDNYGLYTDSLLFPNDNFGSGLNSYDSTNVRHSVLFTHQADNSLNLQMMNNTGGLLVKNSGGGTWLSLINNRMSMTFLSLNLCSTTQASLSNGCAGSASNGDVIYCSDCTAGTNAGSNAGAVAERVNGVWTGSPKILGSTLQKAETGAADANVLTVTPYAFAGTYRACFTASVSSATTGVIAWTLSYKNSNSVAQTNDAMPITQQGTAAPNTTFTTSAAGEYQGCWQFDVDNSATAIVVKWVGGGTTAAKVSATIERII